MAADWYVIHTYAGYENKVKANLEKRVESMNMEENIFRVVVPMENEVQIKGGKRKITPRKVYPGYVLVEIVVFLVEMAVFALTLREHGKRRAALCALGANGASLVLGGLILTYLPI